MSVCSRAVEAENGTRRANHEGPGNRKGRCRAATTTKEDDVTTLKATRHIKIAKGIKWIKDCDLSTNHRGTCARALGLSAAGSGARATTNMWHKTYVTRKYVHPALNIFKSEFLSAESALCPLQMMSSALRKRRGRTNASKRRPRRGGITTGARQKKCSLTTVER